MCAIFVEGRLITISAKRFQILTTDLRRENIWCYLRRCKKTCHAHWRPCFMTDQFVLPIFVVGSQRSIYQIFFDFLNIFVCFVALSPKHQLHECHSGTVSSLNHIISLASLNKRLAWLTSNSCTSKFRFFYDVGNENWRERLLSSGYRDQLSTQNRQEHEEQRGEDTGTEINNHQPRRQTRQQEETQRRELPKRTRQLPEKFKDYIVETAL